MKDKEIYTRLEVEQLFDWYILYRSNQKKGRRVLRIILKKFQKGLEV